MKNLKGLLFIAVFAMIFTLAASQSFAQPPGPPPPGPHRYGPPPSKHRSYCVDRCRHNQRAALRGCRYHSRPGYYRRCERQADQRYHRCISRCRYR